MSWSKTGEEENTHQGFKEIYQVAVNFDSGKMCQEAACQIDEKTIWKASHRGVSKTHQDIVQQGNFKVAVEGCWWEEFGIQDLLSSGLLMQFSGFPLNPK